MNNEERFSQRQRKLFQKLENSAAGAMSESEISELAEWLNDGDFFVREKARDTLVEIGEEDTLREDIVDHLVTILQQGTEQGQMKAAETLRGIVNRHCSVATDSKVINELMDLLDSDNWEVRKEAVSTLGQIGSKDPSEVAAEGGVVALVKMLNDDNSSAVRQGAAKMLGWIGKADPSVVADANAIQGLIKALDDDESEVRWNSASALGQIGFVSPAIVLEMNALSKLGSRITDSATPVRREAVRSIAKILAVSSNGVEDTDIIKELEASLEHDDPIIVNLAGVALLCVDSTTSSEVRENAQETVRTHLLEESEPIWVVRLLSDIAKKNRDIVGFFEEELRTLSETSRGRISRLAGEAVAEYEQ